MKLGIFTKTFSRPTVEEVFEAVRSYNLDCVQFNLTCAGLSSLPDKIDPVVIARIHTAAQQSGVEISAVSGTYNMIHPDFQVREMGLNRLRSLAGACDGLNTSIITLCTGTRDPNNMWHWHPDNDTPEAWLDLLRSIEAALRIAEEEKVVLAIEPEHANVVNSASRCLALIKAMQSDRLKVIMDGANLISPGVDQKAVLDEAFALLGEHIIIAHAKDRGNDGGFLAAGQGILDYPYYLRKLDAYTPSSPLIIHGLTETQVNVSIQFLTDKFREG